MSTVKTSKVISPEDDKPNKSDLPLVGAAPLTKQNSKEVVVTDKEVAEKTHVTLSRDEATKEHVHSNAKSYTTGGINGTNNNASQKQGYKKHSRKGSSHSASSDSDDEKTRVVYSKRLTDNSAFGIPVEKKVFPRSKSYEIVIENEFKDKQAWKERYCQ